MGFTAKGLALIPELVHQSSSTSTAVAAATAAVVGQGISQGWNRWAGHVHAREWLEKPYFARERPSGTKLMTAPDPPNGIMYVKVRWGIAPVMKFRTASWALFSGLPASTSQCTDNPAAKTLVVFNGQEVRAVCMRHKYHIA